MLSNFVRDTAAQATKTSIAAAGDEQVAVSVGRDDAVSVAGAQRDSAKVEQDVDRAALYHANAAASADTY